MLARQPLRRGWEEAEWRPLSLLLPASHQSKSRGANHVPVASTHRLAPMKAELFLSIAKSLPEAAGLVYREPLEGAGRK